MESYLLAMLRLVGASTTSKEINFGVVALVYRNQMLVSACMLLGICSTYIHQWRGLAHACSAAGRMLWIQHGIWLFVGDANQGTACILMDMRYRSVYKGYNYCSSMALSLYITRMAGRSLRHHKGQLAYGPD